VANLVITEFLASNVATNGLLDEDRDNSDWIEIYNRGTNAVNLAGWSLSDDPEVPGFWVFGSRVLNPGQYMIVFASGKDRRNPAATNRFTTNFQLGHGGEHPWVVFIGFAARTGQRVRLSRATERSTPMVTIRSGTCGISKR
jgi:hypothetical protein